MNDSTEVTMLSPFAPVALRLLNHAITSDESLTWSLLLRHADTVHDYFARIGLVLIIYEADGFAYLTQPDQPDNDEMVLPLPRITHRQPLSRAITMVAVVLRDYLDTWEAQHQAGRCHITYADLYEHCQPFMIPTTDERGTASGIDSALAKLAEWEWVVKHEPPGVAPFFELRPLLKAKFGTDILTDLKEVLHHDATGI